MNKVNKNIFNVALLLGFKSVQLFTTKLRLHKLKFFSLYL